MNASSATAVRRWGAYRFYCRVPRARRRERQDAFSHEKRLTLEERLAELEVSHTDARR